MNIGAYIIIFGVGAALMIIGFWIGYAYRATHYADTMTPKDLERTYQARLEALKKFESEPIKGRSYGYTIFDDTVNEDSKIDGKKIKEIHDKMIKDIQAGRLFPSPWPPGEDPEDAPKV